MNIEETIISKQKDVCTNKTVNYLEAPFDSIIGIALGTFESSKLPVNGLRHKPQNDGDSGWYIWAGEYSDMADFFKPIHVKHLLEICPGAMDYLGLPAGWRFLIDADGYEDIWYDESLLKI
jgi:hypothetical protein